MSARDMESHKEYVVDVRGYGHVSTVRIKAHSEREAEQKAAAHCGITVKVR